MLLLSILGVAVAESFIVTPHEGHLEEVLAIAGDGDEILLQAGDYPPFTLSDASLSLQAEPGATVTLNGLTVDAGATIWLSGVVITGAREGLDVQGELFVFDTILSSLGESDGGFALRVADGGRVTLDTVAIIDSQGGANGAIQVNRGGWLAGTNLHAELNEGGTLVVQGGTVELTHSRFEDNRGRSGGAISAFIGDVTLNGVIFESNASTFRAGALYVGADATITANDTVWRDSTSKEGGHIYVDGGRLNLIRGLLIDGSANRGGGIMIADGEVSARNTRFTGLSAAEGGGAVFVAAGEADIRYSLMQHNSARFGAALAVAPDASARVTHTMFIDHRAGTVVSNSDDEPVDVVASLMYDNRVPLFGGQVHAIDLVEGEDPKFMDAARDNYILLTGSPAFDTAWGVDHDGTGGDIGLFGGPDAPILSDADGDGYIVGRDCDDTSFFVNEAQVDIWYDGIDSDCSGNNDYDMDGDGYGSARYTQDNDCDDANPNRHPGATEDAVADGVDADCDQMDLPDGDGDGWPADVDCDDADPDASPGNLEVWYDGVDGDCSGTSDYDQDGDGYLTYGVRGGEDCDDQNAFIGPHAPEVAGDGIDQDCDGADLELPEGGRNAPVEEETVSGASTYQEPERYEWEDITSIKGTTGCSATPTPNGGVWLAGLAMMGLGMVRRRGR